MRGSSSPYPPLHASPFRAKKAIHTCLMLSGVSTFLGRGAGSATSKSVFHRTRPTVSSSSWQHRSRQPAPKRNKTSGENTHNKKKKTNAVCCVVLCCVVLCCVVLCCVVLCCVRNTLAVGALWFTANTPPPPLQSSCETLGFGIQPVLDPTS